MKKKKETRRHLVAVRLSDAEYDTLVRCAASGTVPLPVSTYIRDLIRNADSPMHEREILASVRKMQTDLSFCLGILRAEGTSKETDFLIRLLTEIGDRINDLQKGDGGLWRSQNSHT